MRHGPYFELVGRAANFGIGFALSSAVLAGLRGPTQALALGAAHPWLAEHVEPLSWAAVLLVVLTAMAFPTVLKSRWFATKTSVLWRAGLDAWMAAFVCSAGYLLGLGLGLAGPWFNRCGSSRPREAETLQKRGSEARNPCSTY